MFCSGQSNTKLQVSHLRTNNNLTPTSATQAESRTALMLPVLRRVATYNCKTEKGGLRVEKLGSFSLIKYCIIFFPFF